MIYLKPADADDIRDVCCLFYLLRERKWYENISHKQMPTLDEHEAFIRSKPYKDWRLIFLEHCDGKYVGFVGAVYLSKRNEIGIFLLKEFRGKGYAREAVRWVMDTYEGPFYANINPLNAKSQEFFLLLEFKPLQVTYTHG